MKKLFQAVCAFSAVVVAASVVTPFSVLAIDPSQTVQLTADQFAAMLGDTITGQYLGTDNQYHAITGTRYSNPPAISSCDISGYSTSELVSRPQVWYAFPYPADYMTAAQDVMFPNLLVDMDLHFLNVTYCDWGIGSQFVDNYVLNTAAYNYYVTPIGQIKPWFFSNVGDSLSDIFELPDRASLSGYCPTVNYSNGCWGSMNAHKIENASASDLYLGQASVACVGAEPYTSKFYITINCPVLNVGYQFAGHASPPSGGGDGGVSGSATGGVTGTITTDITGQNVDLDIHIDYTEPGLNAEQQEQHNELSNAMNEYHNLEDSLLDAAVSGVDIDSMPDMEYDPEDFEDAEPIFSFWNVNVIAVMLSWVGIIGFLSYILFGKWV